MPRVRFHNPNYKPDAIRGLSQADLDLLTTQIDGLSSSLQFVDGAEEVVRAILRKPNLTAEQVFEGLRKLGYTVEMIE